MRVADVSISSSILWMYRINLVVFDLLLWPLFLVSWNFYISSFFCHRRRRMHAYLFPFLLFLSARDFGLLLHTTHSEWGNSVALDSVVFTVADIRCANALAFVARSIFVAWLSCPLTDRCLHPNCVDVIIMTQRVCDTNGFHRKSRLQICRLFCTENQPIFCDSF